MPLILRINPVDDPAMIYRRLQSVDQSETALVIGMLVAFTFTSQRYVLTGWFILFNRWSMFRSSGLEPMVSG